MDSLLEMYLYETNTLLEQLDTVVLASEREGVLSQEDIDEIFRTMHTIKGSSAMMEFNPLMTVAHHIEDMFSLLRGYPLASLLPEHRAELFDLMFQIIDYFRNEVKNLERGAALSEDIDHLKAKIKAFITKIELERGPVDGDDLGKIVPFATAAKTGLNAQERNAIFPHSLHVFFDEGSGMEHLRAFMLAAAVGDVCAEEDVCYTPATDLIENNPLYGEQIINDGFLMQFKNAADRDAAISCVISSGSVHHYETADAQPAVPVPKEPDPQQPAPLEKMEQHTEASPAVKESLISVHLRKLDHLMALVGELVTTESMVSSSQTMESIDPDSFRESTNLLRRHIRELQDVAMSLRMVPVSGTFQKMNRIVRDMGKKLDKSVKLTIVGGETEVDKSIVDQIGDPLLHIVRNAMDHGIENNTLDRVAIGKDPVGNITLSARHTGSEVVITVQDDGRGVNYDAVLRKALANGLAKPDITYSSKEVLNFLLMPGFSTNQQVTEYSGRGVGMDVVRKNVEALGGTISIVSTPSIGTSIAMKIPLTMSIMDGMKMRVGGTVFTIPTSHIRQSFTVSEAEIVYYARGGEMVKCEDGFYPIVRANRHFELDGGYENIQDGMLVQMESDDYPYCLFVDELIGEQQLVIKPLPPYMNQFQLKRNGISGCTILGNGTISLVLDTEKLYFAATERRGDIR